jgi:hypothetical protein
MSQGAFIIRVWRSIYLRCWIRQRGEWILDHKSRYSHCQPLFTWAYEQCWNNRVLSMWLEGFLGQIGARERGLVSLCAQVQHGFTVDHIDREQPIPPLLLTLLQFELSICVFLISRLRNVQDAMVSLFHFFRAHVFLVMLKKFMSFSPLAINILTRTNKFFCEL